MAETWLVSPLRWVGLEAAHVVNVLLLLALVAALWRSRRGQHISAFVAVASVGEAAVYAAAFYKGVPYLAGLLDERASHLFFAVGSPAPERLLLAGGWRVPATFAEARRMLISAPVLLALGAGVYEELVFRLCLLGGGALLLRKVWHWPMVLSVSVALLVSSVAFAWVHHLGPLGEPVESYHLLFRTVCGLLLGVIFLMRGLGVAAWTHAIYNALVILQRSGQA
ncbi:MAG: CPBP family glutamic-type intramembrane protease [Planctomycetota bacterium]|jgi:heme/copper-type cytochrome/quinol oxidase subunit 3